MVIPELFERRSLRSALRRTPEFRLAARLHEEPGVVVTHVPALASAAPPSAAATTAAIVMVAEVDDAVSGAVAYARGIAAEMRAGPRGARPGGGRAGPQRLGAGGPCRPARGDRCSVPLPRAAGARDRARRNGATRHRGGGRRAEVASGSSWRDLLHNERALYLAWLLRPSLES